MTPGPGTSGASALDPTQAKLLHEFAGFVQVTEGAGVGSERGLD